MSKLFSNEHRGRLGCISAFAAVGLAAALAAHQLVPFVQHHGLQAGERKIAEQLAEEKKAKERPDPLLNESVHVLADAITLLEANSVLLSKVFPEARASGSWTE